MKEPKKRLSNTEYSSIVGNICVIVGAIFMAILTITSAGIGVVGKILVVFFLILVALFFAYVLKYQIQKYQNNEEDEK